MPDPNFPGMRVCKDDKDNFDPWRLPARQTENIALRFPRPDVSIATGPVGGNQLLTESGFQNGNSFFIEGVSPFSGSTQGDLNTASTQAPTPETLSPYILSASPNNGPLSGGTTVLITGNNFTNVMTVKFGGAIATYTLISPTSISAVSPAGAIAGLADITAISAFGTGVLRGGFTYT